MEDTASASSSTISRSQCYKVAMTARARQRRMRRMKEKLSTVEGSSSSSSSSHPANTDASNNNNSNTTTGTANTDIPTKKATSKQGISSSTKPAQLLLPPSAIKVPSSDARRKRYERHSRRAVSNTNITAKTSDATKIDASALAAPNQLNDNKNDNEELLHLSPQEIRDAANFTSVQFCASADGAVEMMDQETDGCIMMEEAQDTHQVHDGVFMNAVWSTNSSNSSSRREEDAGSSIYRKKNAAGLVGLLTPDAMVKAGLMAPDGDNTEEEPDIVVDSPTDIASLHRANLTFFPDDPSSSRDNSIWKGTVHVHSSNRHSIVGRTPSSRGNNNKNIHHPDSTTSSSSRVNQPTTSIQPSPQLSQLLQQIQRNNKTNTPPLQRAYLTRRKNACGALKILSAKPQNRLKLAWTHGVLDALASVLLDVDAVTLTSTSSSNDNDNNNAAANTEARNRSIATLLNLSTHKSNRKLLASHSTLMQGIVKCISCSSSDFDESKQGCCTILLYLAKSYDCRPILLLNVEGLLKALASVVDVKRRRGVNKSSIVAAVKNRSTTVNAVEAEAGSLSEDGSSVSGSSGSSSLGSHDDNQDVLSEDDDDDSKESNEANDLSIKRMEICFKTPPPSQSVEEEEMLMDYDADSNRFLHGARLSVFACLLCLVKHKENAVDIARSDPVIHALIIVSKMHNSPSHPRAIAILAHLTRSPQNSHHLVFKYTELLPTLQSATNSDDDEARKYALCAIQNLSMDKSCRAPIAHTPKMIASLTERCRSDKKEEVLAAVASIQNLSDEPANVVSLTSAKNNCIGEIIALTKSDTMRMNEGIETKLTQFMAKNTLATISFWFRKIATSGIQKEMKMGGSVPLYGASLQPTGYCMWS